MTSSVSGKYLNTIGYCKISCLNTPHNYQYTRVQTMYSDTYLLTQDKDILFQSFILCLIDTKTLIIDPNPTLMPD